MKTQFLSLRGLALAGAVSLLAALNAETLTFTPKVNVNGQWTWASKENWLTASGGNKAPAEGDDLVIDTPANNFHAANSPVYVQSICITKNALPYSGFSWNGFYVKSGGAGVIVEHADDKSAYSALYLDGEVTFDIAGGQWWQGGVEGRDATRRSRIVKLGAANLSIPKVRNANWAGATIREGQFTLGSDSGYSGIDFHFDGSASSAKLVLGGNITLKDGGLSSSADLPTADHGVYDTGANRTLAISGTPKSTSLHYAGSFNQTVSFVFAPSAPGCTFTAARATSPTTGNLTVSNATFRIEDGASFPSLQAIRVEADATLSVGADAGAVKPYFLLLDAGAKVAVDAATIWEVARLKRDSVTVADGDYTAADCDWVAGEGTVRVTCRRDYVNPICLEVGAGVTRTLPEALADYNAAHAGEEGFSSVSVASLDGGADAARTLVKTGAGTLRMETPIAGFTGDVQVEAGVVKSEVRYGFGRESNANAPVCVHAGATVEAVTTNKTLNVGRTLHIAGTGAAGCAGALVCGSDLVQSYHLANVFGSNLYLDDDATVKVGSWIELTERLTLGGHTLTVVGINSGYNDSPFHIRSVADDGHIVVKKGEWRLDWTPVELNGTDPNNTVTFDGEAGFRFTDTANFGGNYPNWKLVFSGARNAVYSDYHIKSRNETKNVLKVPTVLEQLVDLRYQGDRRRGAMVVEAPVSGAGGFTTSDTRTFFLHLLNPSNGFTGGLAFQSGVIWAYANGTVPNGAAAGAVTLSPFAKPYDVTTDKSETTFRNYFNGIAFMTPETYALPELRVSGTFPARVQNGAGAWTKVTVDGEGGVDYFSELGAPRLDVTKGVFRLPRGAGAGLWEGTNVCEDASAAAAAYAGTLVCTNLAVRGPTMVVREEAYNYTTGLAKELVTYTGYVWNRSATDVTWTFASSVTKPVTLKIDGATVLTAGASVLTGANVTLSPGPHAFEYRTYGDGSVVAPYAPTGWKANFGFAYDVQGRNDTTDPANFAACVDTGDGALFTRTADPVAHLPAFGEMAFATNTTLDVNGNAYTAARLAGWPTVTSSATDGSAAPALNLSAAYVVDGAKQRKGFTLDSSVPVTFAAGAVVSFTNAVSLKRTRYTLLRTTGGKTISFAGETPLAQRLVAAFAEEAETVRKWTLELSADATELDLVHCGFRLFLR